MNLIESRSNDPLLENIDERLRLRFFSVAGQMDLKSRKTLRDLWSFLEKKGGAAIDA